MSHNNMLQLYKIGVDVLAAGGTFFSTITIGTWTARSTLAKALEEGETIHATIGIWKRTDYPMG